MPLQVFPLVWIFLRSLGVICYNRWVLSGVSWTHSLPFCFWPIFLLNELWLFESHNSLKLSFTKAFPLSGNSDHVVVSISIDFLWNSKWDACFLWLFLYWVGWSLWSFEKCSMGGISLNSVLLLLLVNFLSGFRLELMYISLIISISSVVHYISGTIHHLIIIFGTCM